MTKFLKVFFGQLTMMALITWNFRMISQGNVPMVAISETIWAFINFWYLKLIHKIETKSEVELAGFYSELPTIRPFPLHDYMLPIIDTWLNEQFFLIQKSRDMIATWTIVMLYTWDTLFHQGRQHIFQSE